jgi:hypothetical protein
MIRKVPPPVIDRLPGMVNVASYDVFFSEMAPVELCVKFPWILPVYEADVVDIKKVLDPFITTFPKLSVNSSAAIL